MVDHDASCSDHAHEHTNGTAETHKQCIAIVPIFNHLSPAEMSEIVKVTRPVSYKRGETVYRAGEVSEGLYIIHKGRLKIYRLSTNGKEQLIRFLGPGDFTGELSLFNQSVHDAYADAVVHTEICMLKREDFHHFLLKYPSISPKILAEFAARLAETENQAANIAMESTESRIALYLAQEMDATQNHRINLNMSRKDLASYLGTTPETISRKFAEFEAAGYIKQLNQREIEIIDLDALLLI